MAKAESDISHEIMCNFSKQGWRVWKNVRGKFYTLDSVKRLIDALRSSKGIVDAIKQLRVVAAGIQADGSSDLVGFVPVTITQEMINKKIAVAVFIEVKTMTGRVDPQQQHFVNFTKSNGAISGVCRSAEDADRLVREMLKV